LGSECWRTKGGCPGGGRDSVGIDGDLKSGCASVAALRGGCATAFSGRRFRISDRSIALVGRAAAHGGAAGRFCAEPAGDRRRNETGLCVSRRASRSGLGRRGGANMCDMRAEDDIRIGNGTSWPLEEALEGRMARAQAEVEPETKRKSGDQGGGNGRKGAATRESGGEDKTRTQGMSRTLLDGVGRGERCRRRGRWMFGVGWVLVQRNGQAAQLLRWMRIAHESGHVAFRGRRPVALH
jgi:hypothetical protein